MNDAHRLVHSLVFTLLLALTVGCEYSSNSNSDAEVLLANIETGMIQGVLEEGAWSFKGIPYAAAPMAELRWRSPKSAEPWSGIRDASQYGQPCPQTPPNRPGIDTGLLPEMLGDEDCLFLNVWTPADRDEDDLLPVMFFIHGGANLNGSSSEPLEYLINVAETGVSSYEGQRLSARGRVVVVTINYRLGALGFLAHPGMLPESQTGAVGNYGILDQIAALKWVQRNIAAFGGDPARVMLFGQSAGAYDTCMLMASPLAAGLFSRAVMHSGICTIQTTDEATRHAQALIDEVGCAEAPDLMACLRGMSPEQLVLATAAQPTGIGAFPFFPSIDGYVVDQQPDEIVASGQHNRVPFMIGTTADEYSNRFVDISAAEYPIYVLTQVPAPWVDEVIAMYPISDYESATEALAAMVTDKNLTCTSRRNAALISMAQHEPIYRYHFRRILSAAERQGDGAYHTSDLLLLFQHMSGEHFAANDDDRAVQASMLEYWAQFAADGNPNNANQSLWPRYIIEDDPYQILDVDSRSDTHLRSAECDFWDNLMNPL